MEAYLKRFRKVIMITQDKLIDWILLIVSDIQMSQKTRKELLEDSKRVAILELRERLIEIADGLKSIYWTRQANEKNGLLPHVDHGRDESFVNEAKSIFKQMCALNTDV